MAVGRLTVDVVANTARAQKDLKSFRRGVKATGRDVESVGRAFGVFGAGLSRVYAPLAAAAGAAVSFRAFNGVAATLDRTAKASRKLGVTADQLMALRHAAAQTAGVADATLDMALQRMTRRLAEAASTGKGEAVPALEALGLSAKDLAGDPYKAFLTIADAMGKVKDQGERVRLAFKLFDSEGVDLVNTLGAGSAELKKFAAESKKLNGELSAENLAKVEAYSDSMDRLKKATGSFGSKIVIEAAPTLTSMADALSEAVEGLKYFKAPNWVKNLGGMGSFAAKYSGANYVHDAYLNSLRSMTVDTGGQLTDEQKLAHNRAVRASQLEAAPTKSLHDRYDLYAEIHRRRKAAWGRKINDATFGKVGGAIDGAAGFFGDAVGSFKGRAEDFMKLAKERQRNGLNPLTGLAPTGKSEARSNLEAQRRLEEMGPRRPQLNRLIEAGSAEGYHALRANQRAGRGGAEEAIKQTARTTKESHAIHEQNLIALKRIVRFFTTSPAPKSA